MFEFLAFHVYHRYHIIKNEDAQEIQQSKNTIHLKHRRSRRSTSIHNLRLQNISELGTVETDRKGTKNPYFNHDDPKVFMILSTAKIIAQC